MGVCSSCLTGERQPDVYDEDEEAPLFDDPANLQYGSFGEQNMTSQDDDMEAQREMEALQRVMAKTSDNMVDIFEIAPQPDGPRTNAAPLALAGQDARMSKYQNLLSRLSAGEEGEAVDGVYVDWLPRAQEQGRERETIELRGGKGAGGDKPLVGTFADAAAAMG